MRSRSLVMMVVVAACSGADEVDEPVTCDTTWEQQVPAAGAELFGGGPVEIQLSAADPEAGFTIIEPAGLSYTREGNIVGFWPDPPLLASSAVTLTLETCAGTEELAFTTTSDGLPLDGGVDLTTRSFIVDIADATFLRPSAVGPMLGLVPDVSTRLMVGVVSDGGGSRATRVAIADDKDLQDLCSRTIDLVEHADRGFLYLTPTALTLPVGDLMLDVRQLMFTAAIAPDGSAITDGAVSLFVGVQGLADLWAEGDVAQACAFFGDLTVDCVACPDDAAEQCLVLDAVGLSGTSVAGSPVEVTEACPG